MADNKTHLREWDKNGNQLTTSENMVGPEGETVTFETDALAEESVNAKEIYEHLKNECEQIRVEMPYPDITPYERAWDLDDISDLQFKKRENKRYWEKLDTVKAYADADELYSGHIRFSNGGDRYFMEAPGLKTKGWKVKGRYIVLIHVDDKDYKQEVKAWHYPDQNEGIAFSRNITMQNKEVRAVDIVLDRSDSVYANITDNYLRNALMRNKNKQDFQSIIQTIQKKQDEIRSFPIDKAFAVQGCAGSGKTMVLLHRLRYLVYNKDIFSEDYYFLVPSVGFKKYIRDISAKFSISYDNVLSYQGYYQMLLGKADASMPDEESELVFPADYLSRVYSKEYMQECYNSLLRQLINQTNCLTEFCENRLDGWVNVEEKFIEEKIAAIKERALNTAISNAAVIASHLEIKLELYEDIKNLIPALEDLIEKYKFMADSPNLDNSEIEILPDDIRITSDKKWQSLNSEVEAEALRLQKASIFTVDSHRKKYQQLLTKRDIFLKDLISQIVEEEKRIRAEEAMKLSEVFDGVTIQDVMNTCEEVTKAYDEAETLIKSENQQDVMQVVAQKYEKEILALNRLIEASGDLGARVSEWVVGLTPATESLKEYFQVGMQLYSDFLNNISDPKEQEDFRGKFKLFARRTVREQHAYLNVLFQNICRRQIKSEYNIKICDHYKHYWYIMLYCNYLVTGNVNKARRYLFVDEAQDLSYSELELIQKVNNRPIMNLFGDVNQVITSHGLSNWNLFNDDMEVMYLEENFRNTNQIIDYCNGVLPFNMKKIGIDMDAVEEVASVEDALADRKIPAGTTFIVKNEAAADDMKIAMEDAKISDFTIYTVKKVKGLEFKSVVVIDRDMTPNEKYISYTRALSKLTVIHNLSARSAPDINRIVEGEDFELAENV